MAHDKIDPIQEPVFRAAEMYQRQMDYIYEQLVRPQLPQRQMRLGEVPAQEVIDQVIGSIEEG